GTTQTEVIKLDNTNARSIDEAVDSINDALQASNNPTLQHVVALKVNDAGTEKIQFANSQGPFTVSISANAGTEGLTKDVSGVATQNVADDSTQSSGGSNSDVATQTGAQAAVTALADAVSSLGQAQAVVGKGQNNFNYAINLAQSQVTNLAAAESRIREADMAADAANLTKAQVLVQAGTAALAQANSAPQAILSLLRG
ncbi:MAG: flagellin, partial [Acidobacteria bacterium]|nr:flagellin [Acidobacteriota bacterium]